jgi:hypothetical protein
MFCKSASLNTSLIVTQYLALLGSGTGNKAITSMLSQSGSSPYQLNKIVTGQSLIVMFKDNISIYPNEILIKVNRPMITATIILVHPV